MVRNTARLLRIFREEGVRVLLGTDGGFTYITPGFAIHHEVAHYLEAGFSMKQIVRIVTRTAAEFMGGDFGDIREGLRADLLLLNANPFLAPENLQDERA